MRKAFKRLIICDLNGQELAITPLRPCPSHSVSFPYNPFCPSCRSKLVDFLVSRGDSVLHSIHVVDSLPVDVEKLLDENRDNLRPNEITNYVIAVDQIYSQRRYCSDEEARALLESEVLPTPASEAAIEALERLGDGGKEVIGCAICLEGGGTMMSVRLPCKHVFHEGCIVKWLHQSNVCPLCRYELPVAMDELS
ncbi:E3 ubiquitin-protein ligase SDIR1-like [Beta vulgaris subsp. vulgaris]|uniref:E3 ubiquitin-protein ligase SDIR1-like n=1 Tax=Beta vulgaris subsp. vulgaris TaxID=3555 RepID=UPI00053FD4D3|nr:E3 ubiquitin-protein ligase SDIR1-like [Beta vulgaris subsp. vulgaris]